MREDLTQSIDINQPNPIREEVVSPKTNNENQQEIGENKTNKFNPQNLIKQPKILILVILFCFILILLIASLFVNTPKNEDSSINKPSPTSIPLNQPTTIPQVPAEYSDKLNDINSSLEILNQTELPPQLDAEIGLD